MWIYSINPRAGFCRCLLYGSSQRRNAVFFVKPVGGGGQRLVGKEKTSKAHSSLLVTLKLK
jgi:hypothetical protein